MRTLLVLAAMLLLAAPLAAQRSNEPPPINDPSELVEQLDSAFHHVRAVLVNARGFVRAADTRQTAAINELDAFRVWMMELIASYLGGTPPPTLPPPGEIPPLPPIEEPPPPAELPPPGTVLWWPEQLPPRGVDGLVLHIGLQDGTTYAREWCEAPIWTDDEGQTGPPLARWVDPEVCDSLRAYTPPEPPGDEDAG